MNRSRSSPCGFHGNNPFPDLPSATPRGDKLSYGDYADIDRLSQSSGSHHGGRGDNQTTHSGSSSSHIASASQVGGAANFTTNGNGNPLNQVLKTGLMRPRDRSDSSDSRSDIIIQNRSSSRDSPHSQSPHLPLSGSHSSSHTQANSHMYRRSSASASPSQHSPHSSSMGHSTFDPYSMTFDPVGHLEELGMTPNQEQSSQVSSSTDSGYGHGHHVYERINDFPHPHFNADGSNLNESSNSGRASMSSPSQPPPPANHHRPPSPTKRYNPGVNAKIGGQQAMMSPRSESSPDFSCQDHREEVKLVYFV